MRYTNKQIRENILWFIEETGQHEVTDVINYCLGFYGYITKQIWSEVYRLMVQGVITK